MVPATVEPAAAPERPFGLHPPVELADEQAEAAQELQLGLATREQDFRLEDEAIADHAYAGAVAENFS